jgi:hypothetical protein
VHLSASLTLTIERAAAQDGGSGERDEEHRAARWESVCFGRGASLVAVVRLMAAGVQGRSGVGEGHSHDAAGLDVVGGGQPFRVIEDDQGDVTDRLGTRAVVLAAGVGVGEGLVSERIS